VSKAPDINDEVQKNLDPIQAFLRRLADVLPAWQLLRLIAKPGIAVKLTPPGLNIASCSVLPDMTLVKAFLPRFFYPSLCGALAVP